MDERRKFLWGAATSAYQVEGGNVHSDWWEWEKRSPERPHSGAASDHWERFREDFELAKSLGHNAHRLSLEWSRLEVKPGRFSREALEHYREVLQTLKRLGLASFVTLHHFSNPRWFARNGGWEQRGAAALFARYVDMIVKTLGDVVDFWVTINEPMVYMTEAYWQRRWPPQKRDAWAAGKVLRNLAAAHRLAYRRIHRLQPHAQVGSANHLIAYRSHQPERAGDRLFAWIQNWWFNRSWFFLTGQTHDFIGVNYYFSKTVGVRGAPVSRNPEAEGEVGSDLGWPVVPEGLTQVLLESKRYGKPIYVTENGVADATDAIRADFIRRHLRALEAAQAQGADVRGYLHWSLVDNFEWDLGFAPRFGLIEVDYATFKRRPRPSAYVYKAIIEQAQR